MARVSSDEQAKGYSLDVQMSALERYCALNNLEPVYIFKEDHSAKDFNRPEFNRFLAHLKQNKGLAEVILFTSWDRFSRNILDAYKMIERLQNLGVTPQAIEQPIDLRIPENKLILAMYLAIPQVDNERRSIKIKGGLMAAKKAGRWCSKAPIGYRNAHDENNRPIIIPSTQAKDVLWAFRQIASGAGQRTVLSELQKRGLRIQKSNLSGMFRNHVYYGMVSVPDTEQVKGYLVRGIHEPIITESLFNEVQDALRGKSRRTRVNSREDSQRFPFRGLVNCSHCGLKLTASSSTGRKGVKYSYYHCNHCAIERHKAESLDSVLYSVMNSFSFSGDAKAIYEALVSKMVAYQNRDDRDRVEKLSAEAEKQRGRLNRIQDGYMDGQISHSDYSQMRERCQITLDEIEGDLNRLTRSENGNQELIKKASLALSTLGTLMRNSLSERRLEIFGSIFPENVVFDGERVRTARLNEGLVLCLNADGDSRKLKSRTQPQNLVLSGLVENTGFEPVTFPHAVRDALASG